MANAEVSFDASTFVGSKSHKGRVRGLVPTSLRKRFQLDGTLQRVAQAAWHFMTPNNLASRSTGCLSLCYPRHGQRIVVVSVSERTINQLTLVSGTGV